MNALANIKTITKRELGAYFSSALAYVFLVIFLFLIGLFTFFFSTPLGTYFELGEASLRTFFIWHPMFYVFLVPAVAMRLWAEERRVGTFELLMTMPVTPWQAVLGKFIASWLFLGLALVLTVPLWITTNYLGAPDNRVILAAYIGSWLMAGASLAVSCVASAMTRSQVVSFILAFVGCLLLTAAGWKPIIDFFAHQGQPWMADLVSSVSLLTHFDSFEKGVLDSRDIIFYVSLIFFSLFTTNVILRGHRAG